MWISAPDLIFPVDFNIIHVVPKKNVANVGVLKILHKNRLCVVIMKLMMKNSWQFQTFKKKGRNSWTTKIRLLIADNILRTIREHNLHRWGKRLKRHCDISGEHIINISFFFHQRFTSDAERTKDIRNWYDRKTDHKWNERKCSICNWLTPKSWGSLTRCSISFQNFYETCWTNFFRGRWVGG